VLTAPPSQLIRPGSVRPTATTDGAQQGALSRQFAERHAELPFN
jgi:hypothetical protein